MNTTRSDLHRSLRRNVLLAVLSILVGSFLALALGEAVLRLLPVSSGLGMVEVSSAQPVAKFRPDREFVYSKFWNFELANRGRVNNDGWVNDQTYERAPAPPMLAVVGDSYIEALAIPYAQTLQGRLAAAADGRLRVYSFGASGAPLSQYAVWARYAVERWGASYLVVNVVGNDFDESLARYKQGLGFWHYEIDDDGALSPRLVAFRPGILRGLVRSSALARYLVINLELSEVPNRLKSIFAERAEQSSFSGNVPVDIDAERYELSLRAVDKFLADLPQLTGLDARRILFTVDGFRYPDRSMPASYFGRMRVEFMARARAAGFGVIDLDEEFFPAYGGEGRPFELPSDGHWSALGHGIVAEAIARSPLFSKWLDGEQGPGAPR